MRKALLLVLTGLLLAIVGCSGIAATQEPASTTPEKTDFEFILRYGVTGKNVIDTYQNKFTKDMINDPSITIDLRLTEAEMDRIYQKMVEIDFFNYPERFKVSVPPGQPTVIVTPFPIYQFTVEKDSQIKRLDWDDTTLWDDKETNPDVKADKLRELINLIKGIIESREEYKELPEPTGGYL
jgi:hypothetical protein